MTHLSFARPLAAGLGAALASALFLASGDAAATITIGTPQIVLPSGYTQPADRAVADQYWISHDDCVNDIAFQWVVTASETFSVGASSEGTCPQTTTISTSLENCWPVPNASSLASGSTVTISAKDLVQGTLGITNCDPTTVDAGLGITWPQPVTIYFYASTSTAGSPGDSTTWTQTSIALEGQVPTGDAEGEPEASGQACAFHGTGTGGPGAPALGVTGLLGLAAAVRRRRAPLPPPRRAA